MAGSENDGRRAAKLFVQRDMQDGADGQTHLNRRFFSHKERQNEGTVGRTLPLPTARRALPATRRLRRIAARNYLKNLVRLLRSELQPHGFPVAGVG
jgi:hypothetical protein